MADRPKVGEDISDKYRGSGALMSEDEYLKQIDPVSYYYNKLKDEADFDQNMWTESARRGESALLINTLNKRHEAQNSFDEKGNKIEQPEYDDSMFQKYKEYKNLGDYDTYMLALEHPFLDNTEKKDRVDETTGYFFGK